ncbi:hypothetical protein TrVE_jg7645 [Triparma verrucosa]|uniref:Uncharacterized protein n=1 Tax=Triparma verrucosa TaxID=1606542 RepID=A0A9W7BTV5_9STRA|nr:hypothetical protein TrVE_jg7645 [Triparma verrucosa]
MSSFTSKSQQNPQTNTSSLPKLYIPSLSLTSSCPTITSLRLRLESHLLTSSIALTSITFKKKTPTTYSAVITCSDNSMLFKCCNNSQFNGQILTFKKFKDGEQLNMESERWGGSGGFGNDGWEGGGGEKKKKKKNRRRKKGKGKGTEEELKEGQEQKDSNPNSTSTSVDASVDASSPAYDDSISGFHSRLNSSMSSLLSSYGSQTPLPPPSSLPPPQTLPSKKTMLSPNTLSPITLTYLSFGHLYSTPSPSYHDLPPFDIRFLPLAPPSVIRLSGVSLACKRELLRNPSKTDQTEIWETIHDIVERSFELVRVKIDEGYGFSSPISVTVFIGSNYGRHRSPCVAEACAVGLRKRLRGEEGGVGVGVKVVHRDLDRKHGGEAYGKKGRRKEEDY